MNHNFLIQGWHYIYLIVILVVSSSSILISYNNLIDTYKILIYYYWILLSIRKPPNKKVYIQTFAERLHGILELLQASLQIHDRRCQRLRRLGLRRKGHGRGRCVVCHGRRGVEWVGSPKSKPPLLVNITTVYGTSNSIHGVYKHTFNWGA